MPEISLPRRTESVALAADFVEGLTSGKGWTEPDLSRLVLAVTEAVSNAVEHGRGETIEVACVWDGDVCRLTISDDGPGPSPSTLATASLPAPQATGGRGLYILTHLADEVSAESGTLRMSLRRRATS